MYIPKSFLSRLLEAAWTILVISVVLWLAARLLADVWIWIVVIVALLGIVRVGLWWRRVRRDWW